MIIILDLQGKSTMDFVRHDLQEFSSTAGDALKQTSHVLKDTVCFYTVNLSLRLSYSFIHFNSNILSVSQ